MPVEYCRHTLNIQAFSILWIVPVSYLGVDRKNEQDVRVGLGLIFVLAYMKYSAVYTYHVVGKLVNVTVGI